MKDSDLKPKEQAVIRAAIEFANGYLAPNSRQWETDREMPRAMFATAADAGLCCLLVRAERSGSEIGTTALLRVMEELSRVDMATAFALVVHNNHARFLDINGSGEMIGHFLPEMIAGRIIGAFLLTEPAGGSDAAAITTSAAADGDDWVIISEKAWITNTPHADLLNVFAQTDPEAGARGIASFQVSADTPGGIDLARACVAAMCAGLLRTGLDTAMPDIIERHAFGVPLAEQQGLQWQLADVATDLRTCRLLAYDAARRIDEGDGGVEAAAHAKKFATRAAFSGINACMQAMGADGLKQDHPFARHLAAAKMAQYLDGTTEIQNVVISRAMQNTYGQD